MAHARGVRQTFLGDPVLTDLILIRGALSPMARRLGEQETQKAIAGMTQAGLDEQTAHDTYSAVSELVRGSVLLARMTQKHGAAGAAASADDGGFPNAPIALDDRPFELLLQGLRDSNPSTRAPRCAPSYNKQVVPNVCRARTINSLGSNIMRNSSSSTRRGVYEAFVISAARPRCPAIFWRAPSERGHAQSQASCRKGTFSGRLAGRRPYRARLCEGAV